MSPALIHSHTRTFSLLLNYDRCTHAHTRQALVEAGENSTTLGGVLHTRPLGEIAADAGGGRRQALWRSGVWRVHGLGVGAVAS